jgi:HEPN domain-containing protein
MTQADRWLALVEAWLGKAEGDLRAAEACSAHAAVPGWVIGFHLQQACEKLLKALLVLHEREPPRTHNLAKLAALLADAGGVTPIDHELAAALQPFAVDDRHPLLSTPLVDAVRFVPLLPAVRSALSDALGALGERADVLDLAMAGSAIAFRVVRDGRCVLARDDGERVGLVARILRRYDDEAPRRALFVKAALAAGARLAAGRSPRERT